MSDPNDDAAQHFHDQADFEEDFHNAIVDEHGIPILYAWMEGDEDE